MIFIVMFTITNLHIGICIIIIYRKTTKFRSHLKYLINYSNFNILTSINIIFGIKIK